MVWMRTSSSNDECKHPQQFNDETKPKEWSCWMLTQPNCHEVFVVSSELEEKLYVQSE